MSPTPSWRSEAPLLVGVDSTPDGDRAIRFGVEEARRCSCGLRLVHVPHETIPMAPMLPEFASATLHQVAASILKESEGLARSLAGDEMPVEVELRHGSRVSAILEVARDVRAVVLAPRAAGLAKLVLGSTTTGVAARAECPVFCVPHGWDPTVRRSRVVAGVDGSTASGAVLDVAFAAADLRRAELVVLHAWRAVGHYDAIMGGRTFVREWTETAQRELAELVAGRHEERPDVRVRLEVRYARPATGLTELAHTADLLVLGRRGRGAPFGLPLGSTARSMIRAEVCPVEVVPA